MTQFSPTGARNIEQKIGEEVARQRMQMVKIPLLEYQALIRMAQDVDEIKQHGKTLRAYQDQVVQEMIDDTTMLFRCKALNPTKTGVYE